jgi:hypothetical protein
MKLIFCLEVCAFLSVLGGSELICSKAFASQSKIDLVLFKEEYCVFTCLFFGETVLGYKFK